MKNKIALISSVLIGMLVISGCANTIRGAGQDASRTVDATKTAVNDVASQ